MPSNHLCCYCEFFEFYSKRHGYLIGARASQNISIIKAKKNSHVFAHEVEVNQEPLIALHFVLFQCKLHPLMFYGIRVDLC